MARTTRRRPATLAEQAHTTNLLRVRHLQRRKPPIARTARRQVASTCTTERMLRRRPMTRRMQRLRQLLRRTTVVSWSQYEMAIFSVSDAHASFFALFVQAITLRHPARHRTRISSCVTQIFLRKSRLSDLRMLCMPVASSKAVLTSTIAHWPMRRD